MFRACLKCTVWGCRFRVARVSVRQCDVTGSVTLSERDRGVTVPDRRGFSPEINPVLLSFHVVDACPTLRHIVRRDGSGFVSSYRPSTLQPGEKKEKKFSKSLPRELEELDAGWTTLGGAALDAGGRSGPRWTSDA